MKKILFAVILALGLFTTKADAQLIPNGGSFITSGSNPYKTTLDTVINTGTKTYIQAVPNRWQTITLQVDMSVLSGTTTSNTVKFYGSADGGLTYILLYTDTMAASSTSYSHVITGNPYTHYQIVVAGSGTQSSSYRAYMLLR